MLQTCRLAHLLVCVCVCVSVQKVYCCKMVDWIQMPFGMVSGVSRDYGMVIGEGEGAVSGVNLGVPL